MSKSSEIDQLVVKAQAGDSEAFAAVYDELVKPVYRYIFYRVDNMIAEDLTEETFFKAWQNLKKYKKGRHPFSSWLFRIAHNLIIDYYRQNRTNEVIDDQMADPKISNNPAHQADLKLTQIRLGKVIKRLPDNYQQVIVLRYINELDNKEIAATIGKSEGAVRTLQCRALEQLRTLLGNDAENQ